MKLFYLLDSDCIESQKNNRGRRGGNGGNDNARDGSPEAEQQRGNGQKKDQKRVVI